MQQLIKDRLIAYSNGRCIDNKFLQNIANDGFMLREDLIPSIGYILPDNTIITRIRDLDIPIISVGSGLGYLEKILSVNGVDVVASDIAPPCTGKSKYRLFRKDLQYIDIEENDAISAITKYPERGVLCIFPCYNDDWAFRMLATIRQNQYLIYIGEWEGGCNATDAFFAELRNTFRMIESHPIIDWNGLHNRFYIFQKK